MTHRERLHLLDYCLILIMLLLFAALSFVFQINQKFSFDQTQMLLKGIHAIITGEYLPFGNEASTLGNIPGKVSSFVIGFPLSLYNSNLSPAIFSIFLRMVAVLLFANCLALLFSRKIVLIGTMFFAFSPWLLMQTMLYNPAYIALGSALALNMLIRLRNDKEYSLTNAARIVCSCLLVLAVGFILQLHMSWPVLVATVGIMYLRRDIKISYLGVFIGIALIAWSLVPYVQEILRNPSLLTSPDAYSQERYLGYGFVHVYPIFKGILYWFRFGSLLVTKKAVVPEIEDDFATYIVVLCYIWIGISSIIGGLSVVFSIYCNYFVCYKVRPSNSASKLKFIRGLTLSSILAVILASGMNTITLNFWQIAIMLPMAMLPVLAFLSVRKECLKFCTYICIVFYLCANALACTYSEKFDYRQNYSANFYKSCLIGFTPEQCSAYAGSLSSEMQMSLANQIKQDPAIIDRVIKGIIPKPEPLAEPETETTIKPAKDEATEVTEATQAVENAEPVVAVQDSAKTEAAPAPDAKATEATQAAAKLEPESIQTERTSSRTDGSIIIDSGDSLSGELKFN